MVCPDTEGSDGGAFSASDSIISPSSSKELVEECELGETIMQYNDDSFFYGKSGPSFGGVQVLADGF